MKGMWDEPDRTQLREAILDVYRNREHHRNQARDRAPETAVFNWKDSATQLINIIKPTMKRVTGEWIKPAEVRVDIRVNRHTVADIGDHHVDMVPGCIYNVVLNVRDVLEPSGCLEWVDMTPKIELLD